MVSFAEWLASDAKRLHLDVRIEAVGAWLDNTDLTAANDDARYRFAPSMPTYARTAGQPSPLWLPYIKAEALPDFRGEEIDGVFGGIPDFGGISVHLVDFDDALTLLFATEVSPVTVLAEDITRSTLSFDLADASVITTETIYIGGEAFRVTGIAGDTVTCDREYLGTEAVAHFENDPVYVTNPFLVGRRIELRIAPLNANDEDDERILFDGIIDGVEWDDVFTTWVLSATSVLRYIDRIVPREVQEFEISGFDGGLEDDEGEGYIELYNDSPAAINAWIHWTGVNVTDEYPPIDAYVEIDGKEIVGVRMSASRTGVFVSQRAMFGTEEVQIAEGMKMRRVFVSGDPLAHWPSSFRSLDPGDETLDLDTATPSSNWIDMMLNFITSPSEEHGLVQTAPNHDGVHRNYSTLPPGFGLGYPAALIDFDSFLEVRARTIQYVFGGFILGAGGKQKSGSEILSETFLEPMGAYLSVESGLLRIFLPRTPLRDESLPAVDRTGWLLEEVERHTYEPRAKGRLRTTEHASSIKYEIGRTKREVLFLASDFTETVGLRGQYAGRSNDVPVRVQAADEFLGDLFGARAQSRFLRQRRPRVEVEGETKFGTVYDSPTGSMVHVSLQAIPNLSEGVRGWGDVPADVKRREFRLELDKGGLFARLELLAHSPSFLAARIAPAAAITSVATNEATVAANRYTSSDATAPLPNSDVEAFEVGDVVRLLNPDGTSAAVGTQTIVDFPAANTIELDGNFGGALAADLILVAAAYADATEAQQDAYAFEADRPTHTIATGVPARTYGED